MTAENGVTSAAVDGAPLLTIGIPVIAPSADQWEWVRSIRAKLGGFGEELELLVSAHSIKVQAPTIAGVRIEATHEAFTYDENVARIARLASGRYWALLGVDDQVVPGCLARVVDQLRRELPDVLLMSRGAPRPAFTHARLTFLSQFAFAGRVTRDAEKLLTGSGGWLPTALFFRAVKGNARIAHIDCEWAVEDLEPGFIKPWTRNGNYARFQIGIARLVNWLLPDHNERRLLEAHGVGGWPYDLLKALARGFRPSPSEQRFIRRWLERERRRVGIAGLVLRFVRQLGVPIAWRLGIRS